MGMIQSLPKAPLTWHIGPNGLIKYCSRSLRCRQWRDAQSFFLCASGRKRVGDASCVSNRDLSANYISWSFCKRLSIFEAYSHRSHFLLEECNARVDPAPVTEYFVHSENTLNLEV